MSYTFFLLFLFLFICFFFFFFFSSRRRHTRSLCDWSSDVCSSDLGFDFRRQKSNPAERRFEKMVEESPVFDPLFERYGSEFPDFLREKVEIIEGDVTQPGLGLTADTSRRLQKNLDLIINSSGLTDFNPDLRDALAANTDAPLNLLEFVRTSDHAGLLHLSTCYVAGEHDGRVSEKLTLNYNPRRVPGFDAEKEWQDFHEL